MILVNQSEYQADVFPVCNKPVSLNYASWMTNHTLGRICDMDTYFITYSCCCFLYELLLMVHVSLPNASASQDSSERFPFSYLSSDLCLLLGSQVTTVHSCLLILVALVVRQDILLQDVRRNKLQCLVHF